MFDMISSIFQIKSNVVSKKNHVVVKMASDVQSWVDNFLSEFQGEKLSFKDIVNTVHALFDSFIMVVDEKCWL